MFSLNALIGGPSGISTSHRKHAKRVDATHPLISLKCSQKAGSDMTFKQQWLLADSVVAFILLLCLALMLMMLSSVRLP
jgi:hypothetical protein